MGSLLAWWQEGWWTVCTTPCWRSCLVSAVCSLLSSPSLIWFWPLTFDTFMPSLGAGHWQCSLALFIKIGSLCFNMFFVNSVYNQCSLLTFVWTQQGGVWAEVPWTHCPTQGGLFFGLFESILQSYHVLQLCCSLSYTGFESGGLRWGSVHSAVRRGGRAERVLLVRQGGRQGGPASLGQDARWVDRIAVQNILGLKCYSWRSGCVAEEMTSERFEAVGLWQEKRLGVGWESSTGASSNQEGCTMRRDEGHCDVDISSVSFAKHLALICLPRTHSTQHYTAEE